MSCPVVYLGCVDEQSTAQFAVTFRDSAGVLQTPSAVKWELSNEDNVQIAAGTVAALGTTVTIELSDGQLALPVTSMPTRYLSIYATVSSKPWRQEFQFSIRNAQRVVV